MGLISKFKEFRSSSSNGKDEKKDGTTEKEMSFLEHLEELRWHLIRSFAAILVFAIAVFANIQWFLDEVILAAFSNEFPLHKLLCQFNDSLCFDKIPVQLIAISPYEQFLKSISISLIVGFIISFPYFIWEMWRFIKPGLKKEEQQGLRGNVLIMSILFFMGVAFSYYIVLPFSVQFLANYSLSAEITNQWKIGNVIAMVTQIAIGGGLIFEMPILVYYLSKIGLITPEFMIQYRRHAIVILLVLAAMITPPDWITQVLIFIPLLILYQVSIRISRVVNRKREKELNS
ncbi:MAG: twin-arginine translocase subunit TatC [Bacteroidetes bacterium]|nr:twin-arginine translocase subunit TatC [Bacteroidota bacterium]MCB0842584.1 twin-arginine translocase subunit TatC [Bacteroidota bacterium]